MIFSNMRRCSMLLRSSVAFVFLAAPVGALAQGSEDPSQQAQSLDRELAQKLTLAEGHHDLAMLYLKKGDLDKAVAEAREILQLRFPGEYESLVAQSMSIITEKLAEMRRFDLGQTLLDEALKATEQTSSRAKIFRNKARLYMLAGDNDKAIDFWRRALDLESRRIR